MGMFYHWIWVVRYEISKWLNFIIVPNFWKSRFARLTRYNLSLSDHFPEQGGRKRYPDQFSARNQLLPHISQLLRGLFANLFQRLVSFFLCTKYIVCRLCTRPHLMNGCLYRIKLRIQAGLSARVRPPTPPPARTLVTSTIHSFSIRFW